jgi:hypothetical protein
LLSGSILATRTPNAMSFNTRIVRFPGYVQVQVEGPNSIGDFVDLVTNVGQETVFWSDRRVLVDLRRVQGRPTTDEQIFLGELVAQSLGHLERIASIVPPEQITHNSERAAQQLGTQLRVFDNEQDAVAWITAEAAVAPAAPTASP